MFKQKISSGLKFRSIGNGKCVLSGRGHCKDAVIIVPNEYGYETIVAVDANAFINDQTLIGIILPASVVTIGAFAFFNCLNMEVFSAISVERVDSEAFHNCKKLLSFASGTLTQIGTGAFYGTTITSY